MEIGNGGQARLRIKPPGKGPSPASRARTGRGMRRNETVCLKKVRMEKQCWMAGWAPQHDWDGGRDFHCHSIDGLDGRGASP